MIEVDRVGEILNIIFQNFSTKNIIKIFSGTTFLGAVFAERFNRTIRDLLKIPVFEKGNSNCLDILLTKTKQYKNKTQSSTKMTLVQASLKIGEGFVYQNLFDKRKKIKAYFK